MSAVFKYFALGAYAVVVADIIVNRALAKVDERVDEIAVNTVDRMIDRLEKRTGLPVDQHNRSGWLNTLIRRFRREKERNR